MKMSFLHPHLESILERQIDSSGKLFEIIGSTSSLSLVFLLAQTRSNKINNLPSLIITHSLEESESVVRKFALFDSSKIVHLLPFYDVSPYSTLIPNEQVTKQRLAWLHAASNPSKEMVFVAPVQALQQKTIPFGVLHSSTFSIGEGTQIGENFSRKLESLGYQSSPMVEDCGQFALRGGIIDVFSPAHKFPLRIELFGDLVESVRTFSPESQRTIQLLTTAEIIPAHEVIYNPDEIEELISQFKKSLNERTVPPEEVEEVVYNLLRSRYFPGIDFMLPFFYKNCESPLDHFSTPLNLWFLDSLEIVRMSDLFLADIQQSYNSSANLCIRPNWIDLYERFDLLPFPKECRSYKFNRILLSESESNESIEIINYPSSHFSDFTKSLSVETLGGELWTKLVEVRLVALKDDGFSVFIFGRNHQQSFRLKTMLERSQIKCEITADNEFLLEDWAIHQRRERGLIHILPMYCDESIKLNVEQVAFLRDDDFFGQKARLRKSQSQKEVQKQIQRLSFGDINPGDFVVHVKHGVGRYEGLKVMSVNGVDAEFIQLSYKESDKLYLPVYRIGQLQKYSSGKAAGTTLDKLGGVSWEKAKVKVKNHLRDIASELLALYAQRSRIQRPPFKGPDEEYASFESGFPYDETEDQIRAINDVNRDLVSDKPMDRLICGDVGFGKTEVAMRAAFEVVRNGFQVAILAPTTVLSFQHFETFKKRFASWPFEIRALNRFHSPNEVKKTISDIKDGKVDILIGTHRILSKDINFKKLGLLIIDEEHKFGVLHKEKIRKMRVSIDTLTLSATPIPRTLNMSLVGIRDLSFINTPPIDRLPTRTFTCKFDIETIKKAVIAEISRGGQVYFIHNKIESIHSIADEIRNVLPDVRIKVGHGQMTSDDLEQTMVSFFNHDIDVLICTTIVESGVDVPRANTIFIDNAHQLGLSQLYQLRGRVGRSKQRGYCYLLVPKGKSIDRQAQERLRVIQENTALGSGLIVAQHDLELRGAGNLLGDEQSGAVDLVGYELYMDLLNETLSELKGEPTTDLELEPEINLRIPALIPDSYISDIRLRLSYYKAFSNIRNQEELSELEDDLKDQFGSIPDTVHNLMGIMVIRLKCKQLGIRDLSTGVKTLSLIFTEKTPLKTEVVIKLAMRENKKYAIMPDSRLTIKMNEISIQRIYEELLELEKQI